MGKATRWFKGLLGMKKEKESPENSSSGDRKDKRRWSFAKSSKIPLNIPANTTAAEEKDRWLRSYICESEKEQNKHAIAVAAATAAAADAAVAAAQAAVAVVRLTSQNRGNRGTMFYRGNDKWAALRIQSVFRGYLARKALRALKGLVKIQALVRGYLVRKRAAATLYSMQALIRAQASVRSQRALRALNRSNRFPPENRARRSVERFDETRSEFHSKRLSVENAINAYEESPKIVEVDTYRPRSRSRRISDSREDPYYQYVTSSFPCPIATRISVPDCRNLHHYEWSFAGDELKCCTAQSTPRLATYVRSNAPVTPAKSACGGGEGFFQAYSNYPNYMSNTQSFTAKVRSQSAPKQRPEPGSKKRLSLSEIMESRASLSGVRMQRSCTQVQEDLEF